MPDGWKLQADVPDGIDPASLLAALARHRYPGAVVGVSHH